MGWRAKSARSSTIAASEPLPIESAGSYAEFERDAIAKALKRTGGNKVQAARLLKISRKKLYDRIERYGLSLAGAAQAVIGSNHAHPSPA